MAQNATEKSTLSKNQLKAIDALLSCGSITEAAATVGIARVTLYRWRNDPAFMDALQKAEGEALSIVTAGFAGLVGKAMMAVSDGLAEEEDISVRLRAAESVLSRMIQLRELVSIEQRITELEAVLSEGKKSELR